MSSMGAASDSTVAAKRPVASIAAVVTLSLLRATARVGGSEATWTRVFTTQPTLRSLSREVMRYRPDVNVRNALRSIMGLPFTSGQNQFLRSIPRQPTPPSGATAHLSAFRGI